MELKRVPPPDIGKINTDPGVKDVPPEEAEVRRLQQLYADQQKQFMDVHKQLENANKVLQRKNLLDMKKDGLPIDEEMLKRLES